MKCPKCRTENPETSLFCASCGAKLDAARELSLFQTETLQSAIKELSTGSTFAGRYQIIEELGKGGMGRVYKAFDTEIKEKIALKLLKPEIGIDEEMIERFRNELKLARKISQRNVCRMHDLNKEEGSYYITMEYVVGEDLKRLIRKVGQMSAGKTVSIARQVCEGLSEAHGMGIVHRDLKPQNIMVDEAGNAKIMDFGIARSIKVKGITGAGVMIGTPEYMSPEQVEGKDVDQRSDIYSLGIILYEMVTGRVPFEGDTPFTIGVKHKSEIPKDPKELNAQIPGDLSRLILRCLEKDKAKRYQSVEDLDSDLEKIEQGLPTTEHVPPKSKPFTSREITVKFNLKTLVLPALGVAALAVIGIVTLNILSPKRVFPRSSGKPSLAIVDFENITGDPALEGWKTGFPELLITDLSQSKFLYVLGSDRIFSIMKRLNLTQARKYSIEDLVRVADEGGAQYVLSGGLMRAGPKIIITIRLQKPHTGEVIRSEKLECRGEEDIAPQVDQLTRMIKADFNLSPQQIASDTDREIGKITTPSPEAYKYYIEARRFHLAQDYEPAIPLYEKALAIDPDFAMAYRGLSAIYSNMTDVVKMRTYIKKAMEFSDRVSERERLLIQGQYYYLLSERTYDKAIEAFQKLLELYPEDVFANQYLGEIYHSLEEPEKAKEYHLASYKNLKEIIHIWNVYHDFQHLGQYDQAQKLFEDNQSAFSGDPRIPGYLGWNYLYQGKYELALSEADKAFLKDPEVPYTFILKGWIFLLQDNFAAAEKEFRTVVENGQEPWPTYAKFDLAAVYLTQGRFEKAREEIRNVIASADNSGDQLTRANSEWYLAYLYLRTGHFGEALAKIEAASNTYSELDLMEEERKALSLKGILCAEQGAFEKAHHMAEELKDSIQKGLNRKAIRYYDLVEGGIALKKVNVLEAIENFQEAISLLPFQSDFYNDHAFFMEPLARAYEKAGNLEKARAEYEKIIALTSGRLIYGDIYAKACYRLGVIAEKRGQKDKAVEHYRKFLDLWENADSGLPEVEDARKRLEGLKGT